jgi:hypothetical protein
MGGGGRCTVMAETTPLLLIDLRKPSRQHADDSVSQGQTRQIQPWDKCRCIVCTRPELLQVRIVKAKALCPELCLLLAIPFAVLCLSSSLFRLLCRRAFVHLQPRFRLFRKLGFFPSSVTFLRKPAFDRFVTDRVYLRYQISLRSRLLPWNQRTNISSADFAIQFLKSPTHSIKKL